MHRIDIKPLSVNDAWQGRRYKTKRYKKYYQDLLLILPKIIIPKGNLELKFVFGITSESDIDNPLKCLIDVMQAKYYFNDKRIMKLTVEKQIVKLGQEYFEFKIMSI